MGQCLPSIVDGWCYRQEARVAVLESTVATTTTIVTALTSITTFTIETATVANRSGNGDTKYCRSNCLPVITYSNKSNRYSSYRYSGRNNVRPQ